MPAPMEAAMSRLSQRLLQWFFIFGLLALVLTCLVLAGCTTMEEQQSKRRWREADERYARCSKALSANPSLDYQKCVALRAREALGG